MKYMGSKARYAKYLLPIILKDRQPDQWYVEPFAGGFNMIDKVNGPRLANDLNPYTTALFKALLNGWIPPEFVTEQEYQAVKLNPGNYPMHLVGFIGIGCSYSGKWWGGYARGTTSKGFPRNHCRESRDNVLKQAKGLEGVVISNCSYRELELPPNSIIYCDPPYEGTTGYKVNFDHPQFWEWVRDKTSDGHRVYVSEYTAPLDFKCIWQKEVKSSLATYGSYKTNIERLFTLL